MNIFFKTLIAGLIIGMGSIQMVQAWKAEISANIEKEINQLDEFKNYFAFPKQSQFIAKAHIARLRTALATAKKDVEVGNKEDARRSFIVMKELVNQLQDMLLPQYKNKVDALRAAINREIEDRQNAPVAALASAPILSAPILMEAPRVGVAERPITIN